MSFVFQSALSSAFPGVCPVDVSGNGPDGLPLDPTTGNIIPFKPSSDTCTMGRSCTSTLKTSIDGFSIQGHPLCGRPKPFISNCDEYSPRFAEANFVWGSSRLKMVNEQVNPDAPARTNMLIAKATSGSRVFATSLSMVSGTAEL